MRYLEQVPASPFLNLAQEAHVWATRHFSTMPSIDIQQIAVPLTGSRLAYQHERSVHILSLTLRTPLPLFKILKTWNLNHTLNSYARGVRIHEE